jgi:hypothetical protein
MNPGLFAFLMGAIAGAVACGLVILMAGESKK